MKFIEHFIEKSHIHEGTFHSSSKIILLAVLANFEEQSRTLLKEIGL